MTALENGSKSSATDDMIVLDNVSKSYDGNNTFTVREVSLKVPRGNLLALLGGSGCGKTTTLKMINRLSDPTEGNVFVDGCDVLKGDPVQLRRNIGYVIQGSGLFPHMTVAENIAIVPKLLKWTKDKISACVDEMLNLVKLPPEQFRDRLPRQLSGGQQQRVGFARALAVKPKVMLLDEPFGALDPVTRDELRGEFLSLRKSLGLTSVMVTHDMIEALLSADLIAVMNAGKLLRVGTPRELMSNPDDPFVAELMNNPKKQTKQLEDLM
jgi:osmoprotectant transport system ATP-binding protein